MQAFSDFSAIILLSSNKQLPKMKPFVRASAFFTLGLVVLSVIVNGAEENNGDAAAAKENENDEESIKVYKRLIPADVLRGK